MLQKHKIQYRTEYLYLLEVPGTRSTEYFVFCLWWSCLHSSQDRQTADGEEGKCLLRTHDRDNTFIEKRVQLLTSVPDIIFPHKLLS